MRVTFWGVRGCIPAPGPETIRYGGNTPCVQVVTDHGDLLILDAGTGITRLGRALLEGPFGRGMGRGHLLVTHAHWDHIQGFPFFAPVYVPGNRFDIYGQGGASGRLEDILEGQMSPHYNPVQSLKNLGAEIAFHEILGGETYHIGSAEVQATELPHGATSVLAFKIREGRRVLTYAPDVSYLERGSMARALRFYRGSTCLIHDATYSDEDWEARKERGFSSVSQALRVAARARVRTLVLFHYDQDYSDGYLDEVWRRARAKAARMAPGLRVVMAREGLTLTC